MEHFTSLTLDIQTKVVSVEDTTEIWESVKEEVIKKFRENKNRTTGTESPMVDEKEVDKSFRWKSPDSSDQTVG